MWSVTYTLPSCQTGSMSFPWTHSQQSMAWLNLPTKHTTWRKWNLLRLSVSSNHTGAMKPIMRFLIFSWNFITQLFMSGKDCGNFRPDFLQRSCACWSCLRFLKAWLCGSCKTPISPQFSIAPAPAEIKYRSSFAIKNRRVSSRRNYFWWSLLTAYLVDSNPNKSSLLKTQYFYWTFSILKPQNLVLLESWNLKVVLWHRKLHQSRISASHPANTLIKAKGRHLGWEIWGQEAKGAITFLWWSNRPIRGSFVRGRELERWKYRKRERRGQI